MKRLSAGMLLLVLACPLWAQQVTLPPEAKGDPGAFIKVPATTDGKEVRWYSPDKGLQVFPVELLKDSKTAVVTATAPGRYRLVAWTAKGDVPSDPAVCTVVIGEAPVPPDPGPNPPVPPTPATGKRCVIIYESADTPKMPPAQQEILFGEATRSYLRSKTALSADGKNHEWGIFDKDVSLDGYSKELQAMFKRERKSVPWLVIGNDKESWEGPLPATAEEFMTLAKKYLEN